MIGMFVVAVSLHRRRGHTRECSVLQHPSGYIIDGDLVLEEDILEVAVVEYWDLWLIKERTMVVTKMRNYDVGSNKVWKSLQQRQ